MKSTLLSLVIALVTFSAQGSVNERRTISFEGRQRTYVLYVPDNIQSNAPIVVSLHGASGHDTDRSPFRTSVADLAKCIVVYPQGELQNFGPFGTVPGWDATGEVNTDVRFLRTVVDEVAKSYSIDRQRIYCCGFSNGGMMTYANAHCSADFFAAFASISGFPLNEFHHRFTGARPVPFLHIHGKADDFVKYSLMPVIRDAMVARNGLNPVPQTETVAGRYTRSVYSPFTSGESFPYEYIEVDGMGHNDFTDRTADGNSALTMWNFLCRYRLSDPCSRTLRWRGGLDIEGFSPAQHGWDVYDGAKRFAYGTDPASASNNVYHSVQFEAGHHRLALRAGGGRVYVELTPLTGSTVPLFSKLCDSDRDVVIPFTVTAFGHYRLRIVKESADVRLPSFEIHSCSTPAEASGCVDAELPPMSDMPVEPSMTEIPQSQGREYDDFARTAMQQCDGYTLYTATADLQIAFKMMNVDMQGCNRVVVLFAEPVPQGWYMAFHEGNDLTPVPTGASQMVFELTPAMIASGRIPQICMMTFFGTQLPLTAKVKGVYKSSPNGSALTPVFSDAPSDSGEWIDLQGVTHAAPTVPGIYIHNGRKQVVR